MVEWNWDSSDIGDMTPESFGDDYYYTGGKFTDWSGKSEGKFDEKPSYWDESSDEADEDSESYDDSSDSSWDSDSSDNDY